MRHLKHVSSLLALGLLSLGACTDDPAQSAAPSSSASSSVSVSGSSALLLAARPAPDDGKIIAGRDDQTGAWKTTVGAMRDSGALDIEVACAGGGFVSTSYGRGSLIKTPCDGATVNRTRDEAAASGAVKLSVTPDGAQHWSIRVTRGSVAGGTTEQPDS
ncbi:hypothetical protein ACQP2X_08850 [Actinoplanes sp. CA-131856]